MSEFDSPIADFATPFWNGIDARELRLPRCSICGRWQWYPEPSGTDCTGGQLIWETVAQTGTLYSFSVVHRSFLPTGGQPVPYTVGMVDLDGVEGPRLVANLEDDERWTVGDRVAATFVPVGGRMHPVFRRERGIAE
jgi:uncharacterized OB-fold protein